MAARFLLSCLALLLYFPWHALAADEKPGVYATLQAAAKDRDFAVQGEYTGDKVGLQVIALGDGNFRVVTYQGGLPGAGWDGKNKQPLEVDREDAVDLLKDFKKVTRKSPTLGAKPPKESVVLFDGTNESLKAHWKPGARMTEDGLLMEGCTSKDTFRDFRLHIEFRLPYMPKARGQGRGNSGIYYQGRYETQMLDSFGLEGKHNETGGIYSVRDPDLNMCLPPLSWQTYDVDFTAARWEGGKKVANAKITVRLNGVIVQQNVEIPKTTTAAPVKESPEPGPIYLQNHGNPVRYRNIWVLPKDADQEARRPIVPGYERFHTTAGSDLAAGGRVLLGELNCTSCHQPDAELAAYLTPKQAPILDKVGSRVRPEYLARFIADPHSTKAGTTMPNLFAGMTAGERDAAVSAIVNFLVTTGRSADQRPNPKFAANGDKVFHRVGCVACHMPREGKAVSAATSVPLVDLGKKYTIASLGEFLQNPHAVRPSGRMPNLMLDKNEIRDLAHYLVGDVEIRELDPNMHYAVYHGSWDKTPNFDELKPVKTGQSAGFDLTVAGRTSNFGIRFEGLLNIRKEGTYTFHLGSDDGSFLYIDGNEITNVDGLHPHTFRSGKAKLSKGLHPIRVDYFQGGGEWTLELDYQGPGVPRQSAQYAVVLSKDQLAKEKPQDEQSSGFVFDQSQVEKGRELFTTVGCASCHQLKQGGSPIESKLTGRPLADLKAEQGCLSAEPAKAVPDFALTRSQRDAIAEAISQPSPKPPSPQDRIAHAMTTFNCYACHARGGKGGPTLDRNPLFITTIPEMGDEGRVPPPLDGVGDKLKADWLAHVLDNGAKDRPYMLTRMPKFNKNNIGHLTEAFVKVDQQTSANIPELTEPLHRVKATGRFLVGGKALSCIKCHNFGKHKGTGVQAIDLQAMTKRIREDWFFRYMPDPPKYRPGTRMPTGFPKGKSTVPDAYGGDPGKQLAAIWAYLSDGSQAGIPEGLLANAIVLKPETHPIIYRNFLEGLSPRGIAVGYPEKAHLAWDANHLSLSLLWHGKFIDASKHWVGRGPGKQRPLGDHIIRLEGTVPVAVLDSSEAAWPTSDPRERGYEFRGYKLDEQRRPIFQYQTEHFSVEDHPVAKPAGQGIKDGYYERHITVTAKEPVNNLYFLAGSAQQIEPLDDGRFLVGGILKVRILSGQKPVLRKGQGRMELLVPLAVANGKAEVVQELIW